MTVNKKLVIPTARELFQSIRTIRTDWQLKSPLQKWCYLYAIGKASLAVMFIPLFEEDQTLHWFATEGGIVAAIHILLCAYTICYHTIGGELAKGLPCTCLLGCTIAVSWIFYRTNWIIQ